MKNKTLSIILAIVMVIGTIPVTVFAGDVDPKYTVTNGTPESDAEKNHGYITIDKATAAEEDTVTVTVKPAEGYQLKSLNCTPVGFVDLGVKDINNKPLYWAERNLGASKAESPGDYYMWGATALMYSAVDYSKTDGAFTFVTANPYGADYKNIWNAAAGFDWNNVPFTDGIFNSSSNKNVFTKYTKSADYAKSGNPDNLTVLKPEDDAATAENASWRMPTSDELVALAANCVWEWTSAYNGTGSSGYIVYKAKDDADKGKANMNGWKMWDASNSKYVVNTGSEPTGYNTSDIHIFLPAAGYSSTVKLQYFGKNGGYWASTLALNSNTNKACSLNFSNSAASPQASNDRRNGYSVRPVIGNSEITPEKQTDGTYQFTMPAYAVTVTAEFEKVPSATPVDIPTAVTGLVYNGLEQTGVEADTGYTLEGNKATNAGEYTATATLADGYIWSDGTLDAKEIKWSIAERADYSKLDAVFDSISDIVSNEDEYKTLGDVYKAYVAKYIAAGLIDGELAKTDENQQLIDNAAKELEEAVAALRLAKAKEEAEEWFNNPFNSLCLGYYSSELVEDAIAGLDEVTKVDDIEQYKEDYASALVEAREEAFKESPYSAMKAEVEEVCKALGFDKDKTAGILADFDEFVSGEYNNETREEVIGVIQEKYGTAQDDAEKEKAVRELYFSVLLFVNSNWIGESSIDPDDIKETLIRSMILFDDNDKIAEAFESGILDVIFMVLLEYYPDYERSYSMAAEFDNSVFDTIYAALRNAVKADKEAIELKKAVEEATKAIKEAVPEDAPTSIENTAEEKINSLASLTSVTAVEEVVKAAKEQIAKEYAEALADAKENAITAINESVPAEAGEEVKELALKGIEAVNSANSITGVNEAKEGCLKEIKKATNNSDFEPCTNRVNTVCDLYNSFIDIPYLNIIFAFVHIIIHLVKG